MASSHFFMFSYHFCIMIRRLIYVDFFLEFIFIHEFIPFIRFFHPCVFIFVRSTLDAYLHFGQLLSDDNVFHFDVVSWIIFLLDFGFDGNEG